MKREKKTIQNKINVNMKINLTQTGFYSILRMVLKIYRRYSDDNYLSRLSAGTLPSKFEAKSLGFSVLESYGKQKFSTENFGEIGNFYRFWFECGLCRLTFSIFRFRKKCFPFCYK